MRNPARSRGGGIGHDCHGSALEEIRDIFLGHVAPEFDSGIIFVLPRNRCHIARCVRMVPACYQKLRLRRTLSDEFEGLNYKLQPFVSSPLAERQDAMYRIAPSREVGVFGTA